MKMKEIEANKKAWGLLSKDQYERFKGELQNNDSSLGVIIEKELGNITGKTLIHLQCNTGADSIKLARKGAIVTGVDLVPENIFYAKKLAHDCHITNIEFIESDIMELQEKHTTKYDIVFTSEGAIGWLPDLRKWAQTIRKLLKDDGFFYILDSHPFFLMFDESQFKNNELCLKYPYFIKDPEYNDIIGGYASYPKKGENYFWMYTVSEIINSLIHAGLTIEYFNEYDCLYYNNGGMEKDNEEKWHYPFFDGKIPFEFSLKARVR
jgi:SAM-dependent methyltransferase